MALVHVRQSSMSVLLCIIVSQRSAQCHGSGQCPNYYDYYVPPLSHSTRCTAASNGTNGCMSAMCELEQKYRHTDCNQLRTAESHCWQLCGTPEPANKTEAARTCRTYHSRLPLVDLDTLDTFDWALDLFEEERAWVQGGPKVGKTVSADKDDWIYPNGTVIPDELWRTFHNDDTKRCIQWRHDGTWRHDLGMENHQCGSATPNTMCQCGDDHYPAGALTRSSCIGQRREASMARECWRTAKELLNDANANSQSYKYRLDNCQCAWCTENCTSSDQWTKEWWKEPTTTATTVTTAPQSPTVMTTPKNVVTGAQNVLPLIPTVDTNHTKFTSTLTVTLGHKPNRDVTMLAAMCTMCVLSLLSTVLCATLLTLSAIKHWQHKNRMDNAIRNAGKNRRRKRKM